MEPIIGAWAIHNRINLFLLQAIDPADLAVKLDKGKSVASNFAHIHSVRLMWIKASAPDLLEALPKLDSSAADHAAIRSALEASSEAVAQLLTRAGDPSGRVKGFKPDASAFFGYLVAHESYHRAMVEIALRQAGKPLNDRVAYGLWEWGVR